VSDIRVTSVKALLAHPGTQYSFRLARQLERLGCLSRFWTGIAYLPNSPVGRCIKLLPASLQRKLANRELDGVAKDRLRTRPLTELRALNRLRTGQEQQRVMLERNATFQRHIPDRELDTSTVVIGFDTSSWLLAERSVGLGRTFILDRSIAHPTSFWRLLPDLRRRFPEWAEDLPKRLPELLRAEDIEHCHATWIVVPSSFARKTLIENGVARDKIVVIPFGVDLNAFHPTPRPVMSRPLRFVFVGSLCARKGLPLLVEAWRSLSPQTAELWLVGPVSDRVARLIPAIRGLRIIGKVSGSEVPDYLRQCDVLVFPSYFEGLAQVQLEAMASGLPIISTEASGASDLIVNGEEGFLIPSGDTEALRDAMEQFISSSADLEMMSTAARSTAERFSWDHYGNRWMDLLGQTV
jgi:starch synthase